MSILRLKKIVGFSEYMKVVFDEYLFVFNVFFVLFNEYFLDKRIVGIRLYNYPHKPIINYCMS